MNKVTTSKNYTVARMDLVEIDVDSTSQQRRVPSGIPDDELMLNIGSPELGSKLR